MRQILILLLFAGHSYGQTIGELKLVNSKVIKVDTVSENFCGQIIPKTVRLTVSSKTKVQLSCNYGDPSKNAYGIVTNEVYIYYAYDTTKTIYDSVLHDIKMYVAEQEEWAKEYNRGKDFSYLPFNKSFYVNNKTVIPFIWTGAENKGDYQLFYLNRQVYKIVLFKENNGMGSLSSFVEQNMYFTKNAKKIPLGKYIVNTDTVNQIIAKE